jgi:hypothetical protein
VTLPEHTKVYVVLPDVEIAAQAHVYSPRLAHPEQAADFAKQIIEVSADTELWRVGLWSAGTGGL